MCTFFNAIIEGGGGNTDDLPQLMYKPMSQMEGWKLIRLNWQTMKYDQNCLEEADKAYAL